VDLFPGKGLPSLEKIALEALEKRTLMTKPVPPLKGITEPIWIRLDPPGIDARTFRVKPSALGIEPLGLA